MPSDKPVYVALFLTAAGKKIANSEVFIKHPQVHLNHLTLAFGKAMKPQYPLGEVRRMKILAVVNDDKGQALVVSREGLEDLLAEGQNPHITVSCAEGVAPKYSNELLKTGEHVPYPFNPPLEIEGVVDYYPRTVVGP